MRISIHRRIARRQADPPPSDLDPSTPSPPSTPPNTSTTAPSNTPSQSPTSTTTTPSSTSNSGLLGGLFGPSSSSSSSSSSTTTTSISANPHTTGSHTFPGHASITSLAATVIPSGPLSTSSVTITSTSATASQPNPNANNDSGPIAGGVIGGIFAVAALGMLVSFLLRRWRRRQIDRAVFGSTDFRKSAMALDDDASTETLAQQQRNNPRPPTMIERRVAGTPAPAQQRMHAGVAPPPPQVYGGYGQPFYPPQSMQRGYYPQQPDRPYTPHLQPAAYNQMYNGGGPPRTQTPLHQPQLLQNSNSLLNPYEAPSVSPMPSTTGDGESAGDGPPTME